MKIKQILSLPNKSMRAVVNKVLDDRGVVIIRDPINSKKSNALNIIKSLKKESRNSLLDFEFFYLYTLVKKAEKISGDVADVGVYKGGSAKIICEATKKQVHLFDTFKGLPKIGKDDKRSQFKKGEYCASLDSVKHYLKKYSNVYFYIGLFPSSASPIKYRKFSFVHLHVDLYESTLDCLKFFYPRMNKGGIIISHDYTVAKGVKKAFDEFFKFKSEIIMESLVDVSSQCVVVKV